MSTSNIIEEKYKEATAGINEGWLISGSNEWFNYVTNLPDDLKITYLIVVFYNQVINGGFHQYFVNGYGQFSNETVQALQKIGAAQKANFLKEAYSLVNKDNFTNEDFRQKLLKKEMPHLFIEDDLFEPLDMLDRQYYSTEYEEDISILLTRFLNNQETKSI